MKAYHKRLLTAAVAAALLLGISGVFISDVFQSDARQLRLSPQGLARSASGLNRTDRLIPTREAIDEDGYDTALASSFEKTLSNDQAELYFNASTAEIALRDLETGQVWYSNPQDRDEETMVEGTTRLRIGAQLTIAYYDAKGTFSQMDSYNDCIVHKNMQYSVENDVLTVRYHLGKTTVTLEDVPQQISASRMEKFSSLLSEKDREDLLGYYRLASIQGQTQSYIDILKEKYPHVIEEDTYYLTKDSSRILKKIRGYLDEAGYTWDDLDYDNRENQVTSEPVSRAFFEVTLAYRLEGGDLVVIMPGNSLLYDAKIPPYEIRLLEYFGAGGTREQGYFLLPDGSGTLLVWNNGKKNETPFSMRVYGNDTVCDTESAYVADEKASLPVFGIKNGRAGLLVVLEKGEALCTLCARPSGMQNSYNAAYPAVMTTAMDRMTLSDSQQIYFEETPYRGDVQLRYALLKEADADYMGMARVYRQRLKAEGALRENEKQPYPLVLDIICAAPSTEIVAGLPVSGIKAMTSYDEALGIARRLNPAAGQVWLRLEGWMQGGLRQPCFRGVRAENALGGRQGLDALLQAAKEEGYCLLPDVYLQTAFTGSGLSTSSQCVRDLCRDIAVRYRYDYLSRYRRFDGSVIYQLNGASVQAAAKALKGAAQSGLDTVSIPDTGSLLYSDFTRNKAMNRVEMQEMQRAVLAGLSEKLCLSLPNPSAYALSAAGKVYSLPCTDSGFRVTDESVPFYQAVIRGSIAYAGEPLNYADDYRMACLQAVEFGAGLQYTLTAQTTALLKDTNYSYLNKGHVDDWAETIRRDYEKCLEAFEDLGGVEMTEHRQLAFNLYETVYADGTRVIVNYADETQWAGQTPVPGKDFVVIKAGEAR